MIICIMRRSPEPKPVSYTHLETMRDAKRAAEPVTLGEDEYFVLGDNRNDSSDSRSDLVGNVKKSQIVGKAFVRIYPFNRICILKHQ